MASTVHAEDGRIRNVDAHRQRCAPVGSSELQLEPVPPFEHEVHFYDRDDDLFALMGVHLVECLRAGDVVVIVATPSHRRGIETSLRKAGIDTRAARVDGRLLMVDAAETLDGFMVEGVPDAEAFGEVVGALVGSSVADGRQIRIYGEMVAVLWEAGNVGAAIELERLWNGLGTRVPFGLVCAYPATIAADPDVFAAFDEVCRAHSDVIGEVPIPSSAGAIREFPYGLEVSRAARLFVAETLAGWHLDDLVHDAMLIVSELTTNSLIHANSDVAVSVSRAHDGVRLEVFDSSGARPQPRDSGPEVPGGWGMRVVSAIASRWGHEASDDGKVVWAELSRPDISTG